MTIGRDCKIARDVLIMDTDQHPLPGTDLVVAPVVIEDRVWIGARAIVLKGVQIGHDSVVGAGAIVTRSVPPGSIVVGTAARVIRTLDPGRRASVLNEAPDWLLRANRRLVRSLPPEFLTSPQQRIIIK